MNRLHLLAILPAAAAIAAAGAALPGESPGAAPPLARTARSGAWSAPETWEEGALPPPGARVLVRAGHAVLYDMNWDRPVRSLHVAGTLRFARDRDTRLDAGLIRIQAGESVEEDGFACGAHVPDLPPGAPRATLEVGTAEQPIPAGRTARIRLVHFPGMDPKSCPALVCCGGRLELHGAPMSRTWVKLARTASPGDAAVLLDEPVTGWRPGDRVILTATRRPPEKGDARPASTTEERRVQAVEGTTLRLDRPLEHEHFAAGELRGEVANLSRGVVVESADPSGIRGHTMFHRGSAGSIGYAEFRHLGKEGVLGRYSLHFHLAGDTMRGASVIGASIWDSANRWLTIHGTRYLVVRDCVGFGSRGHGFFLEDGTEVYNVLDRNLAVGARRARPLPDQVMPFDRNDGAGFWWSNSLNTFTRNVAVDCDEYGYRFDASRTRDFSLLLPVALPDGTSRPVDIRTLPFVRFEDNEAHCQPRYGLNLGGGPGSDGRGGVDGVGPDPRRPFVVRRMKIWDAHWAFHPVAPSLLVDGMLIARSKYAVWKPVYTRHNYRGLKMERITRHWEYYPVGRLAAAAEYPRPLDPVDDLPPTTVITHASRQRDGRLRVRGTAADNGEIRQVLVNGRPARAAEGKDLSRWEIELEAGGEPPAVVTARAEDDAGNVEALPHRRPVD